MDEKKLDCERNEYQHYGEEQLIAELFKKGSLSVGKVDGAELDEFYERVRPVLTGEQSEKIRTLIIELKNEGYP